MERLGKVSFNIRNFLVLNFT